MDRIICVCFACGKGHDLTASHPNDKSVKCECGGYVITPSGRSQIRVEKRDK